MTTPPIPPQNPQTPPPPGWQQSPPQQPPAWQQQGWQPQPRPQQSSRPPAPAPVPGAIRPRSRGVRATILAIGAVVALGTVAAGSASAIARTHVYPSSVVEGSESATAVEALEIKAGVHDVVIATHAGPRIEWQTDWYGRPENATAMTLQRSGSTLTFTTPEDHCVGWCFNTSTDQRTLTIQVPEDLVADLDVDAGAGTVTVEGTFGDTVLEPGVGDVRLHAEVGSFLARSGVGRLEAEIATEGSVVVEGGVGTARVDLGTTTAPQSIDIEGGVGTVTVLLPVLQDGYSFSRTPQSGIGTVTIDAPAADPGGLRTSGQVPLSASGGIGTVSVQPSTADH